MAQLATALQLINVSANDIISRLSVHATSPPQKIIDAMGVAAQWR